VSGPRRSLPLRWRGGVVGSRDMTTSPPDASAAFVVVSNTLQHDLQRALQRDAERVAALYGMGVAGSARDVLVGPTGGVIVQLYDPIGQLIVASTPRFEAEDAALPAELVAAAGGAPEGLAWRGTLAEMRVQAALAPFDIGVVAVLGDTRYIGSALAELGRSLALTAVAAILISAAVGFTIANAIVRPIVVLAGRASALGPDRLDTIPYDGPRDEVGRLAEVLNDLLARLRQAADAQRSFLAETSHELRTPLTALQGFLERASRRARPEVQRDLQDAQRIAASMSLLVRDLLQLSRGETVTELEPHLLDPTVDVLIPIAEEYPGVQVEAEPGFTVVGDPERLRQLLRNLTANAVRAAGAPELVTLRARVENSSVRLAVHDCGPGVPADMAGRIFDKFFHGPGGGSGLGLAIAQQIAKAHGTRITFESRPGDTRFSVSLATADVADEEPEEVDEPSTPRL
jgi:two-component system, OmpR family, sensor kinase